MTMTGNIEYNEMKTASPEELAVLNKDGHWITTEKGNHVLIEDSMSPQSLGLFTLDPVGMAYSMGITNYTPESDINSIMDANNGWPEVVYCFGKSMRPKDPETERYLSQKR